MFTRGRVEGRLFKPMAWTVAFALMGALTFSMLIAPVLSSVVFRGNVKEWHNPAMQFLIAGYRKLVRWVIEHRWVMIAVALAGVGSAVYLSSSGLIGSEFLPPLDEGAIWA